MIKYADIRAQIKSGDLLAWRGNSGESWIVRIFTGSSFSHLGVAWVIGGRVFVLEAAVAGIRIYPLSRKLPFFLLPSGGEWTDEAEEFALAHVGDEYSRWEAIKGYLGLRTNPSVWQCAEFVIDVYRRMGLNLYCRATPECVLAKLLRNGATLTEVN